MTILKRIHIHPLTLAVFLVCLFIHNLRFYFILYLFIFFHELSHLALACAMGVKYSCVHLFPWGCVLSIDLIPSKLKSVCVLLAGPMFNILMFLLNIFPKENLSLALFNLMPVMPLDGGMLLNVIFPSVDFYISLIFVICLTLLCLYMHIIPLLPLSLLCILFFGRKSRVTNNIDLKVLRHFRQK